MASERNCKKQEAICLPKLYANATQHLIHKLSTITYVQCLQVALMTPEEGL